jgi:hypothetical protein
MDETREPDSIMTIERAGQSEKQAKPSLSMVAGMRTAKSDEHCEKAESAITESVDPVSNETVARE